MTVHRRICLASLLLLLPVAGAPADGPTYKYRDSDGNIWFTDRPASGAKIPEYEFVGYHGRPPARASCRTASDTETARRAEAISGPLAEYANRFGVDPQLARAIVSVESCFDPEAVSRVGAQGLMQLMPATARALGVEDVFNIHENLRAGVQYFKQLHRRYDGDTVLALAAYNAGPAAVDRHDGIPPYRETQRYVTRVLENWNDYRLTNQRD